VRAEPRQIVIGSGEPPAVEPASSTPRSGGDAPERVPYAEERCLLYIEDTAVNVRLVEAILARRPSIQVVSEPEGGSGLERARELVPDLILLDLHLPDMTGHEVLARLRADTATAGVPVLILSATVAEAERSPLLAAGAIGCLTKPIGVDALLGAVDAVLATPTS
jgi:CheY-like chemotaxis protein